MKSDLIFLASRRSNRK